MKGTNIMIDKLRKKKNRRKKRKKKRKRKIGKIEEWLKSMLGNPRVKTDSANTINAIRKPDRA